ncbi:MAG: 6-carboxytetrahydropterin synthase QueD [Gemmatimonadetes bacterium]|nr:6-carboxytetrahydropterin synthase QueD [Gemmatimonadota bacterium]NIR77444.1 6-carboxytetrahydropterin synthase QueD [Gemmatimonadota bacterium]NIT85968.1 6-carboxytetrahydropterin synthase QueD [Gemmatimonadota bacterium]NIU29788.1 6-carboxytetrahydropterin synthase QueD [Gemmatimonadota bacterium]NIU34810.1 6-carboxytetrahydropterin synthase QueD [Gemmatimonadota bacterium]
MYTVSVQAHYDAAHFLRNYKGKCERLHGHRYVVEVAVQVEELNDAGIAVDFVDLKGHLRELADGLDHRNLNDLPPFSEVETSAENQARYFYEELKERLPEEVAGGLLYARVWETPTQWAQYGPHAPVAPAHRSHRID